MGLGVALVSLGTPLVSETVRGKWFDFPRTLGLMVLPIATIAAGGWLWRASGRVHAANDWQPYAAAVAIFTLAFIGLAYSLFPFVVIDRLTIWEAATHPAGLKALMVGAGLVLPFIVGYTILSYRIFRGKATKKLYD